MIRVVIVDDDPMVRTGLRLIISAHPDMEVVADAGDGRVGVSVVRTHQPDVVLLDVRMPIMDGLAALEDMLRDGKLSSKVIMLTTFDLDEYVYRAVQLGASGFLLKDVPPERLVAAIQNVHDGDVLLSPAITRRLVARYARPAPSVPGGRLDTLTERERQVLELIARGLSNAEIAAKLFLGETTVKTHIGRILGKLDVRDRAQAVIVAYESGLVSPSAH